MNRLGIELLSVFGMNPVEHVELAAELGCAFVSTGLSQLPFNPLGYRPWSLRDDAQLRRDMRAAMRDTGVTIALGEGLTIRSGSDVAGAAGDLDLMAELGAACIGAVSLDTDIGRTRDQLARLAELAAHRRMRTTIEFVPGFTVSTFAQAVHMVDEIGLSNLGVLVDAMHFFRSGGELAALAAARPEQIAHAQICDVPLQPLETDYLHEAMFCRRAPGEGDLPLAAFVAALPPCTTFGLEIPNLAQAKAGIAPQARLWPAVEAARTLMDSHIQHSR